MFIVEILKTIVSLIACYNGEQIDDEEQKVALKQVENRKL